MKLGMNLSLNGRRSGPRLGPELIANTAPNARVLRDGVTLTTYVAAAAMVAGRTYRISYTITGNVGTQVGTFFIGSSGAAAGNVLAGVNGPKTFTAVYSAGATEITFSPAGVLVDFVIASLSVREVL